MTQCVGLAADMGHEPGIIACNRPPIWKACVYSGLYRPRRDESRQPRTRDRHCADHTPTPYNSKTEDSSLDIVADAEGRAWERSETQLLPTAPRPRIVGSPYCIRHPPSALFPPCHLLSISTYSIQFLVGCIEITGGLYTF